MGVSGATVSPDAAAIEKIALAEAVTTAREAIDGALIELKAGRLDEVRLRLRVAHEELVRAIEVLML